MKRGMSEMWWIISTAVIALVVVILILVFFGSASGKTFGEINDRISGLGDTDKDNVANTFDKCPNTPSTELADANGCSPSQTVNPTK